MSDPLAALLAEMFPAAERTRWPFTVDDAAEALRAAGVTLTQPQPDWSACPTGYAPEDHGAGLCGCLTQPQPDRCGLTTGCLLPKHERNKLPCITEGPHGERRDDAPSEDAGPGETRPCTEGPGGGTCDGSDHVRHLVWSCFTATEMGRHRDAYAQATIDRAALRSEPAAPQPDPDALVVAILAAVKGVAIRHGIRPTEFMDAANAAANQVREEAR